MRWLILIPILLVCGVEELTEPVIPNITAWFEEIPDSLSSRSTELFDCFGAYATQEPADTTYWRLSYYSNNQWVVEKDDQQDPGQRAGHNWYTTKGQKLRFMLIAWGRNTKPDTALWSPK